MLLTVASVLLGAALASAALPKPFPPPPPPPPANFTYFNPVLPGWHSDPSCVHVDGTFFCATSTFLAFPGLPIYASKDLIHWKLASHVWSRPDQLGLPDGARNVNDQQGGFYAPNLRYRKGVFYVTNTYVGQQNINRLYGTIFTSKDPYSNAAWSNATLFSANAIDPDLFWDDDGKVYISTAGILINEINLTTGEQTAPVNVWTGTINTYPEGPHIYKRDGYYYLLIAEGGTGTGHRVSIARSKNITGPYESNPANPILTNTGTSQYFQGVGHADLFQDAGGRYWAMALATRSGPDYNIFPMGREAVLTSVTWAVGQFPFATPVRGNETGWPLPPKNLNVPGIGPFNNANDSYTFAPKSSLPNNLLTWRSPVNGTFIISPAGHPNSLQVQPTRMNLTGIVPPDATTDGALTGKQGHPFIGRRQTDSLFTFGVDLDFRPTAANQEAGISAFLTQLNHIDLAIASTNTTTGSNSTRFGIELRLRVEASGQIYYNIPSYTTVTALPASWATPGQKIHLQILSNDGLFFGFSAWPVGRQSEATQPTWLNANIVSGGSGQFTGTLLGVYATCNGAGTSGSLFCPAGQQNSFSNWSYQGQGQRIDNNEIVPSW
ncbi:hypothetical protein B0A48_06251 [Cryoendolithus antarcticus]|uniref:Beta-xylosidase C-terminal Concanavalin A-like domain-containing protein n=1 Tax=Cryoendolithus antarcticus TaxID=1507870 RepID=A0A1V8TAV3_9PEZI|nr:hypothetical protein B0A48_06251 [Cryoendolithus antarcticus]